MKTTISVLFLLAFCLRLDCLDTIQVQINDTIKLRLIRVPFYKENYRIQYWTNTDDAIISINNELVFGTDATLPKFKLASATLIINKRSISLPTENMYDPWTDNIPTMRLFSYNKYLDNPAIFRGLFSIGAGIYGVEWRIFNNLARRTIITDDWHILDNDFIKVSSKQ